MSSLFSLELALPRHAGEGPESAKVIKYWKDKDGLPTGTNNDNPIRYLTLQG